MFKKGNTRMVATYKIKRITLLLTVMGLCLFLFGSTAGAVASSISKGYKTTDEVLVTGMAAALVSDTESDDRIVEAATTENSDKYVGIITTVDDNLVSFSGTATDVLASTEGEVNVYVSNLNGSVLAGDLVSISPLAGVLMRSDASTDNRVVGVALQDFSDISTEDKEITTSQGNKTYQIGKLKVEINQNIVSNTTESDKSALILAGESLTGKSVSQIQILAALVIFAIVLIVEGSIIYGAIHSTVTALGRNPLAKKAVFRQLLQVSWIAIAILVVGFGAIYLILWV